MKTHENEDPVGVFLPAFDHLIFLLSYLQIYREDALTCQRCWTLLAMADLGLLEAGRCDHRLHTQMTLAKTREKRETRLSRFHFRHLPAVS